MAGWRGVKATPAAPGHPTSVCPEEDRGRRPRAVSKGRQHGARAALGWFETRLAAFAFAQARALLTTNGAVGGQPAVIQAATSPATWLAARLSASPTAAASAATPGMRASNRRVSTRSPAPVRTASNWTTTEALRAS